MTANERLEKLLNRAGQTISDLPTWGGDMQKLGRAKREALTEMGERWTDSQTVSADEMPLLEYILRLTDIIDRMETALENQVTLHDNLMHVIGNADVPDDVSYEQFCLVVDSVYKAVETTQEGWESCEGGRPDDWRADDD